MAGVLSPYNGTTYYIAEKVQGASGANFEVQDLLGHGGNANVHKCANQVTGQEFAMKIALTQSAIRIQRFKQEINILKQLKHPQLMPYVDHGEITVRGPKGFQKQLQFLVTTLGESNLKKHLEKAKKIPYEVYSGQFRGLAGALATLHGKALHRDIKPENILVSGETWILCDLGLCKILGGGAPDITEEGQGPLGPRFWMSPESANKAIGNRDEIMKQSDVFQLSSVFWFVVTGRHPSGVVNQEDWTGPRKLFDPLFLALSHNHRNRPKDGTELQNLLDQAIKQ